MPPNKTGKTKSQGRASGSKPRKKDDLKPIEIPMNCLQNFEKLDHPHIRRICENNPKVQNRCIMCEHRADPTIYCKTCNTANYCSWECQVDDQPLHSLVCAQWFRSIRQPTKSSKRAIFFPAQSTTPVFAWAKTVSYPDEPFPRLHLVHDELRPWIRHAMRKATPQSQLARLGCINECRALAARTSPLGHSLFVIEWAYPGPKDAADAANVGMNWVNKSIQASIQASAGLAPGQSWFWTGPIAIISLDLSRTSAKSKKLALDNVTLRDLRHAIDFFTLNLRNPALPAPIPALTDTTSNRAFPFPTLPAIKLNELNSPLARTQRITKALEQVHVSRNVPPPARAYQGVPAVCAALGLAWVVRVALNHGEELDWLYEGFYPASPSSPSLGSSAVAVAVGGGGSGGSGGEGGLSFLKSRVESESDSDFESEYESAAGPAVESTTTEVDDLESATATDDEGQKDGKGNPDGSIIPTVLDVVLAVDEQSGNLNRTKLPRSGDGVVLMHAGGGNLHEDHVRALLEYVEEAGMEKNDKRADEVGPKGFNKFWKKFKAREDLSADVPSPYDLTPTLCRIKSGQKFVVCQEIFKRLVPKVAPAMRVLADGTCTHS